MSDLESGPLASPGFCLEDRGLLTREPDPADARAYRLKLTPTGRATTRKAITIAQTLDAELFGPTPARLRATLRKIAEPT